MPRTELIEKRTRNSKTYHLGGRKYAWAGVIGAIHYKDNPKDDAEQWKDIDTTISADGKVRKAPYDLDIYLEGMPGFRYRAKESGEFDIRLKCAIKDKHKIEPVIPKPRIEGNKVIWENIYPDTDVVLKAGNTGVSLKRILKSTKAPLEYDIDIKKLKSGVARLMPLKPANDAKGQQLVMEEKAITGGRTEKLRLEVLPQEDEIPQPIAFPIEDATVIDVDVGASSDDAWEVGTGAMNLTGTEITLISDDRWGGFRFTSVNIPDGATVTVAYMSWYLPNVGDDYFDGKDIYCEDGNNPGTFTTTSGNISDRTPTTNKATLPSGQQGSGWVNTPSLVDPVQEVVDDNAGTGDALVFILDSTSGDDLDINTWDYNDHSRAPGLYIEYTVAGQDYPISTSCNLSLATSIDRDVAWARATSANLSLTTTIDRALAYTRATTSNLSLTTSISRAMTYARATSSNLSLAVSAAIAKGKTFTISTALSLTTSISRTVAYARASSSSLSLTASVNRVMAYARAISSNLTLATNIVKSWGRTITTSASLSLTTSISRVVAYTRATSSNLALTANVVRTRTITRATSAAINLSTTISRVVAYVRATSSALSLAVTIVKTYLRPIALTLAVRSFALTLQHRAFALTLPIRSFALTLQHRIFALTLRVRSFSLTLPWRR